ncbi:hypothetical protein QTP88_024893 [Uroleucon formosanum]
MDLPVQYAYSFIHELNLDTNIPMKRTHKNLFNSISNLTYNANDSITSFFIEYIHTLHLEKHDWQMFFLYLESFISFLNGTKYLWSQFIPQYLGNWSTVTHKTGSMDVERIIRDNYENLYIQTPDSGHNYFKFIIPAKSPLSGFYKDYSLSGNNTNIPMKRTHKNLFNSISNLTYNANDSITSFFIEYIHTLHLEKHDWQMFFLYLESFISFLNGTKYLWSQFIPQYLGSMDVERIIRDNYENLYIQTPDSGHNYFKFIIPAKSPLSGFYKDYSLSGNSNWYKILYSVLLSLYGPSSSVCVLIYP